MVQFFVLYIPAMATLGQPAAHRGASAAALRAMCMCVLATIAGRFKGVCSSFTPYQLLRCFGFCVHFVFTTFFLLKCVQSIQAKSIIGHRRRKHIHITSTIVKKSSVAFANGSDCS